MEINKNLIKTKIELLMEGSYTPDRLLKEITDYIEWRENAINYSQYCTESKDKYKTDFDEWKISKGYVKDEKHKCYFKGNKAYFDFNLIEEYNNEVMDL